MSIYQINLTNHLSTKALCCHVDFLVLLIYYHLIISQIIFDKHDLVLFHQFLLNLHLYFQAIQHLVNIQVNDILSVFYITNLNSITYIFLKGFLKEILQLIRKVLDLLFLLQYLHSFHII